MLAEFLDRLTTDLHRAFPGIPPTPVDILLRQLRHVRGQLLLAAEYRVARSDKDRAEFRDRLSAWNQGSQRRPAKEVARADQA